MGLGAGVVRAAEEVTATTVVADRAQLDELSGLVSVDRVDGLVATVVGTPEQLAAAERAGFVLARQPAEKGLTAADMCPAGWVENDARSWGCYPTYPQYVALMQKLAADHSDLCVLESIGATTSLVAPHELLLLKITDNPGEEEDEPEVLYTSTMHGDETTGAVLLLRLADELLKGHGTDPELTALVDGLEIWINPFANPDGTYQPSDTLISSPSRSYRTSSGGSSGVDPNRNFPDPAEGPHPDGQAWWAETQHWMAFAEDHTITLSANFHGGVEVVNYPWDTWARLHTDDAWFAAISRAYADQVHVDSGHNGYMTYLDDGITNGYAWYRATGGRQDFFTYFHGGREVTIELSDTKLLPASQLDAHWTWNRQALLDYLEQAFEGIRGVVLDDLGRPVAATVELVGHDQAIDNTYVYTDPDVGDYHRLIGPGTYTVRITAFGHVPFEAGGVTVAAGAPTVIDATLPRLPTAAVAGEVVTPALHSPIAGATVEILGAPDAPAVTGADGRYAFAEVFAGTFTIRVTADGYQTVEVERTIEAPQSTLDFVLAPLDYQLFLDLEADDGGLVAGGSWQHGAPSGAGNPGAHSGSNVWGTVLGGDYTANADWSLELHGATVPAGGTLDFWHSYRIEQGTSDWDGGNVAVRPAGGSWSVVTPVGGYVSNAVNALGEPGFTGDSGGWQPVRLELGPWAGQTVDLRWRFASDGSVQEPGWYLDDIALLGATEPAADFVVEPASPLPGQAAELRDRSSGAVTAWAWDFGDGAGATVQNPPHTWAAEGTYQVHLVATWADGDREVTLPVTVGGGGPLFQDDFESGGLAAWSSTAP